jgi:hypothetical protein
MASFGIENKSGSIQKFNPANIKYRDNAITGFRTFLRGWRGSSREWIYQPFMPFSSHGQQCGEPKRNMYIGSNELEIEEITKCSPNSDELINLQTNVLYYTIPNEKFPGLVRKVTFTNLDPKEDLSLDVVDGLAELIPFGLGNSDLDAMFRTREAWMRVYNIETERCLQLPWHHERCEIFTTTPFFHITQSTEDSINVKTVQAGHFVVTYFEGKEASLLPIIYDPSVIFGSVDSDLMNPVSPFDAPIPQKREEGTGGIRKRHGHGQAHGTRSRIHEILSRKQVTAILTLTSHALTCLAI